LFSPKSSCFREIKLFSVLSHTGLHSSVFYKLVYSVEAVNSMHAKYFFSLFFILSTLILLMNNLSVKQFEYHFLLSLICIQIVFKGHQQFQKLLIGGKDLNYRCSNYRHFTVHEFCDNIHDLCKIFCTE